MSNHKEKRQTVVLQDSNCSKNIQQKTYSLQALQWAGDIPFYSYKLGGIYYTYAVVFSKDSMTHKLRFTKEVPDTLCMHIKNDAEYRIYCCKSNSPPFAKSHFIPLLVNGPIVMAYNRQ